MIYIYDILLNFCDSNRIYDFYEWNTNDNIENIKKIKLVYVNKKVYDDILNYDFIVDNSFLLKIYNTCEVYQERKSKTITYAILFSDGARVLAVTFLKNGLSISKSKLLLDEEDEIAILASNLEEYKFDYKLNNKVLETNYLTRKELLVSKYLKLEIEDSFKNKKYDKLKYIYQECFDKDSNSYKEMKDSLLSSLEFINNKHLEIYSLLKSTNKKKQV